MKIQLVLILFFMATWVIWADDKIEFSGEHRAYLNVPASKSNDDFNGNIKVPRVENDLKLYGEHSSVSLYAGVRVTNRVTPSEAEQSLSLRLLDNYLSINLDKFKVGLGFQTFNWGTADNLNPTDNLNPRDYTLGLDAEKLPLFAVSTKLYLNDMFSIEAVYAPFDQPDRFPVDVIDYIPDELFTRLRIVEVSSTGMTSVDFSTANTFGVKNVVVNNPSFDMSSYTTGGRFKITGGSFDISASYQYDLDQFYTPVIQTEQYSLLGSNTIINAPLTREMLSSNPMMYAYGLKGIVFNRNRLHRIGVDAKTVADRFGIWAEACLSITEKGDNDYESRGDQLDWTIGTDFSYGSSDQHYLNLQHVGRYIYDFDTDFSNDYPDMKPGADDLSSKDAIEKYYYRLLTNRAGIVTEGLLVGAAIRSEWSFFDGNLKPVLEGMYLFPLQYNDSTGKRYGEITGNVRIDWRTTDAVLLSFGTEGYYSIFKRNGSDDIINLEDTKIGMYFPDSRIFIKGTFNWAR